MSRESIQARVAAACSPAPWRAEFGIIWAGGSSIGEMDDEQDAPLVAHARQDVPALLAVADAAAAVIDGCSHCRAFADGFCPAHETTGAALRWVDSLP